MRSITFYLCFVPILALLLLIINLIFAPHSPYQEKSSIFECGFHSFMGQNRTQFSISFFIYALLFLLFDLELLLVFPYASSCYVNETYGFIFMIVFFMILTVGFAFELGKKALNIDTKATKMGKVQKNKILHSQIFKASLLSRCTRKVFAYIQLIAYLIIAIVLPGSGELIVACAKISKRDSWGKKMHKLNTLTIILFKGIVKVFTKKLDKLLITIKKPFILIENLFCKLYSTCIKITLHEPFIFFRFCIKIFLSKPFNVFYTFYLCLLFFLAYILPVALLFFYYCLLLYLYYGYRNVPSRVWDNICCWVYTNIAENPKYCIITYIIVCSFLPFALCVLFVLLNVDGALADSIVNMDIGKLLNPIDSTGLGRGSGGKPGGGSDGDPGGGSGGKPGGGSGGDSDVPFDHPSVAYFKTIFQKAELQLLDTKFRIKKHEYLFGDTYDTNATLTLPEKEAVVNRFGKYSEFNAGDRKGKYFFQTKGGYLENSGAKSRATTASEFLSAAKNYGLYENPK